MYQRLEETFIRSFVERLHSAVNAHDADAVAELCTEDVEWLDPAAAEPLRGREAVRRFHRETMFRALPDVRIELAEGPYLSLDGASVATRLVIRGTMTGPLNPPGFAPTGERIEFETLSLFIRLHAMLGGRMLKRGFTGLPRHGRSPFVSTGSHQPFRD